MSDVLDFFRAKSPALAEASDEDATLFIGQKYPEFLGKDKAFADSYWDAEAARSPSLRAVGIGPSVKAPVEAEPLNGMGGSARPAMPGPATDEQAAQADAVAQAAQAVSTKYLMAQRATDDPLKKQFLEERRQGELEAMGVVPVGPEATIGEALTSPLLTMPRLQKSDLTTLFPGLNDTAAGVIAGAQRGLSGAADFFTSPLGIATLGTGALPAQAQQGIALGFAADMARNAPKQFAELGTALGEGDYEKAAETATGGALNVFFAKEGFKHGLEKPNAAREAAGMIGQALQERLNDPEYQAAMDHVAREKARWAGVPQQEAGIPQEQGTKEGEAGPGLVGAEPVAGEPVAPMEETVAPPPPKVKVDLNDPNAWVATTPIEGREAAGKYDVVEARALVTSFDRAFDPELQPRDRTREASQAQVADMANNLEPQRLGASPTTDMGAPLVDELDQVLSGNGRSAALREHYGSGGTEYRDWLERNAGQFGIEPKDFEKMRAPVLVRRVTDFGGLSKGELARQSNQQQVLGFGEAEKAAGDGKWLAANPEVFGKFAPDENGNVLGAENRDFLNAFIKASGDRAELLTKDGYNGTALSRRVKNAVLGVLLEGKENGTALRALIEQPEEFGLKPVAAGLLRAAPLLARLRGEGYDLGASLGKAVRDLVRLKTEGGTVEDFLGQMDLLRDAARTPETDFLLSKLAKAKTAKAVAEPLVKYAERAKKIDLKTGDIFGAKPLGREELLREVFAPGKAREVQGTLGRAEVGTGGKEGGKEAGTLATIEQATLPRRVEGATELPTPGGQPTSLADIRKYLSEALDIPIRARRYGQRALGIFKQKPETIRTRALNDIATVAHEVGHYLHFILFPEGGALLRGNLMPKSSQFGGQFDGELMALGARTSKPSYTPHQVRQEGVAEWFREWLTDRTKALAKAPAFTQMFEGEVAARYPEIWRIVNTARVELGKYINLPAMMKVRSRINREREDGWLQRAGQLARNPRPAMTEWWEKIRTGYVDELRPMERALEQAQALGLGPLEAKRVSDYAVNYIGGWRGKVEYGLHQRQIDLEGNDVGPSLREILAGIEDVSEFEDWLVARRELELSGRGIKTGMDGQDAADQAKEVARLGGKYFAKAKLLDKWQENDLRLLEQAGILSGEQVAKMRSANKSYVPFHRVMEGLTGTGSGAAKEGFVNLGQGVHRLKGSDRQYVPPLESIVKNSYAFRDLAERNRVASSFVEAIQSMRGGGRIAENIAKQVKPVQVSDAEVRQALEAAGVDLTGTPGETADLAFKVWRAAKQAKASEGIFTVWKNGKETAWQLSDPALYRALTLADSNDAAVWSKSGLLRGMRGFTRVLRAGATLTADFIARNPFRDQVTAAVNSRYGFVPFFDGFRGIASALRKDEWYWQWAKSGGRYADFISPDRTNLQEALQDLVKEPTMRQRALQMADPRNYLKHLQTISELMEQATRIGEFRRAKRAGASDIEAANAAKDVTLNFSRGGTQGKFLNQLVAFFNAGIQDISKLARAHQEAPVRTALKGLMYITAPSLLGWWLGKDDEEIQKLPEWRKNYFWNVNVGPLAALAGVQLGDRVLSFPKPFLLGQIYGSSVERGLDYIFKRDPNAVKKWFSAMLQATPFTVDNLSPTFLRPTIETMANYSFFRGARLENESMQRLPAELRYTPQSSLVARELAKYTAWSGMELSPVKTDNLIRGYLGGMGKYGTDAADWLMTKMESGMAPAGPAKGFGELPGIKGFVRPPYEPGVWVERFYKGAESAEQTVAAAQEKPEKLDAETLAWIRKHGEDAAFYLSRATKQAPPMITELRSARKALGEVNQAMAMVQTSAGLSPEEKRAKLIMLNKGRDRAAEAAFRLLSPGDQRRFR